MTFAAGGAAAQEADPSGVEEVVVAGPRQPYRGQVRVNDLPQAISLIDDARLEALGITRLADALDLSASVARQNNFGGLWESFAIRGLVGDENNPSGYLVNGFNAGRGFSGPRDVSGVERIEILKGPNAALFGRGEPGGSVNFVTKRPTERLAGTLEGTLGSFAFRRLEGDINLPARAAVGVRLVGFYEASESFRDTIESKRYGIFPSALVSFSPSTSLVYDLEATRQEIPLDRGVVALRGQLGVVPVSRFLGEPAAGPNEGDAVGHQLQLQHDFSPKWSLLLGAGLRKTSLEGNSVDAELTTARQRLFVDGRTLTREMRYRDYDGDHKVYRAELSGTFDGPLGQHRLIAGADKDSFDATQLVLGYRAPALSTNPTAQQGLEIDLFNPVYGRFPLPALSRTTDRLISQRAWGVYVQDQIRVNDRLEVRIGARYDDFSQEITNYINGAVSPQQKTRISPQAGVVWRMSEPVSLYAAYGEGFRANTGASVTGQTFDPEQSRSTEIGAKLSLGPISGNLAVFKLRKTNILTSDLANPGFSIAIGAAESQGVELELGGRLPGDVEVGLSYTYFDAKVILGAINANGVPIRPGDRLLNVPEQTLSAQASRRFSIAERSLNLGAGLLHVSDRLGEVGTTFRLPAYTVVRVFSTFGISDNVQVSAVVNNLFDETHYLNSYAQMWVQPGSPRNVQVRLRIRM